MTSSTMPRAGMFFEDFAVGAVYRHARAKTVTEMDNVLLTNLVLNTAQAHFNEHDMLDTPLGHRITFGGVTTAMVVGLVSQDVAANAEGESGFESIRLLAPVLHGDTLYAYSEVLEKVDGGNTGTIRFRHHGMNQHGRLVFTGVRTLVMRRRPASHV